MGIAAFKANLANIPHHHCRVPAQNARRGFLVIGLRSPLGEAQERLHKVLPVAYPLISPNVNRKQGVAAGLPVQIAHQWIRRTSGFGQQGNSQRSVVSGNPSNTP
jgi:hypothetical protein